MNSYSTEVNEKTKDSIDCVSMEKMYENHTRSVVGLLRSNGKVHYMSTKTASDLIDTGNDFDPETREPFTNEFKNKVKMYMNFMKRYPDEGKIDTCDIYKKFLNSIGTNSFGEAFEDAKCYLQYEDFKNMYIDVDLNDPEMRVKIARKMINENRYVVLRQSRVKSTEDVKTFSLVIRRLTTIESGIEITYKNTFDHCLCFHVKGHGFYVTPQISKGVVWDMETVASVPKHYEKFYNSVAELVYEYGSHQL